MTQSAILLKLVSRRDLGADIFEMVFEHAHGQQLGAYPPGAHTTLKAPGGQWRSYSLCGSPADVARWTVAVKRERAGRGGSIALVEQLEVGDEIEALAPQNFFALSERAHSFLFIAGGIGITPLFAMIQYLHMKGMENYRLIYCTREPSGAVYRDALLAIAGPDRVLIHHDQGSPDKVFDFWPYLETPGPEHIYCCGPAALMDSVRDMTGHWPTEQIHFESFSGSQIPASANEPFEVVLHRSGRTLNVPADKSLLQVLQAAGVYIASSCESGSCGSCRTGLLQGVAQHRDLVLDDHERSLAIMPCVSRSQSPTLVLDL